MKQKPERALVLRPSRSNSEPYTTSEIIAEGTGNSRHAVRQLIETYEKHFKSLGRVAFEMQPLPTKGGVQMVKVYRLNEPQATFLLTLLKNTPVVVDFKVELVRQFYAMRQLLQELSSPVWRDVRSIGKEARRRETDAIKELVAYAEAQGSQHAVRYYTIISTLANRTAGIEDRDRAPAVQLVALLNVEQIIASVIREGIAAEMPYKEIYQAIKNRLNAVTAALECAST